MPFFWRWSESWSQLPVSAGFSSRLRFSGFFSSGGGAVTRGFARLRNADLRGTHSPTTLPDARRGGGLTVRGVPSSTRVEHVILSRRDASSFGPAASGGATENASARRPT